MNETVIARHAKPGMSFRHNNRIFTATQVGKYQGTVKINVEGYKFALDFAPLHELELVEVPATDAA